MVDYKRGIFTDKIMNYLGNRMKVDLKNHHRVEGTLAFYHLTEQMIHLMDWDEYDEHNKMVRKGRYMVVNRTAWFQLYTSEEAKLKNEGYHDE